MTSAAPAAGMAAARNMAHGEQLSRIARKYPGRTAYISGDTIRTFGEVDRRVTRLANALAVRGLHHGDRLAVLMTNSIEMLETILAGWRLGAIVVPVNFRLVADEVGFILGDCGASVIVVDVNLGGVWNTCRAALPHLIAGGRGGAMVLTSSTAGIKGYTDSTGGAMGYTAAKHGVVGIMRALANELAPHSIRVNSIHPTGVNTMMAVNPFMQEWITEDPQRGTHMVNALPVELLEPEDISNAVAFLVSDQARFITGVMLPIDAGFCNK